ASCSKHGQWSCLRCKVCYCDEHIKRRGFKYTQGEAYPCPKCNFPTKETKDLAMSTRAYDYGRKGQEDFEEEDDGLGITNGSDYFTRGEGSRNFTFGGKTIEERAPRDDDDDDEVEDDEDDDDDDEDEDEDDDDDEEEEEEEGEEKHDDDNEEATIDESLKKTV
ncbi:unnamed protein product, partial [Rotaria magnacalcarata]